VSLEERVEATVYGLETRLEDENSIEAIEVRQVWDDAVSRSVRAGCQSKALKERARWKRVADGRGELARRKRFLSLLDAG
jgi:hypothetical protein